MLKLQQQEGRRIPRLATRGARGPLSLVVGHASPAPSRDESPVYVFDVRLAIIVPVQAKAGDSLVVRSDTVTVMDRRGATPVPVRGSALDAPALLRLVQWGAVTPRSAAGRPGLEALAARKSALCYLQGAL
jgi:hypothetical protein